MLNMAEYFLGENIKQGRGEHTALFYRDRRYTYDDIYRLTNRVGNLLKILGVEPENRVYLVLNDSPELVAAFYGTIKIGAVATMAYPFLQAHDYEHELNYIRPKVVISDDSAVENLRKAAEVSRYPKSLVVVGNSKRKPPRNEYSFSELIEDTHSELDPEPTSEDDIALWKFSGGTTGLRKAIPHRHVDAVYAFQAYHQIVRYHPDDVVLSVPKMFFGYGRDGAIVFPFRVGASAILFPERFTPERVFRLVKGHRPSILVLVPTAIRAMLDAPRDLRPDFSCVRVATSAGEALSPELYAAWRESFQCEVLDGIGSAEMYYVFISNRLEDVVPGTLGKIVPGYEAEIVDGESRMLPDGEVGVLRVRGESAGTHYHHDRLKSQKTFRGEWIYTDDLFSKDRDGYFRFAGRRDDLLKVSGYFVSPYEIEKCIESHPDVTECAVVGVEDEDGLTKSKAFVVLKPRIDPLNEKGEEIKRFCKRKLAPHKFPRFVEFLSHLPKTGLGKVDRLTLLQRSRVPEVKRAF